MPIQGTLLALLDQHGIIADFRTGQQRHVCQCFGIGHAACLVKIRMCPLRQIVRQRSISRFYIRCPTSQFVIRIAQHHAQQRTANGVLLTLSPSIQPRHIDIRTIGTNGTACLHASEVGFQHLRKITLALSPDINFVYCPNDGRRQRILLQTLHFLPLRLIALGHERKRLEANSEQRQTF